MKARLLVLPWALTLVPGCKDDGCALSDAITPGCGLEVEGEALRLGDSLDQLAALHGQPELVDLGAAGSRFDLPAAGVAGFCSADDGSVTSLMALEGFTGATAEGLGVGSAASDVQAALGDGEQPPYLGGSFLPGLGIGFETQDDEVTRVHVFPYESGN